MCFQRNYQTEIDSLPVADTARRCLQVEYEIMTAYIQNKTSQLDAVLEVLFQDTAAWPQAPPPTYLRDACLEVVYTLVGWRLARSRSKFACLSCKAVTCCHIGTSSDTISSSC